MSASLTVRGEVGLIVLTGTMDFSTQDDFRQVIEEALNYETINEITIDMAAVDFMDSSAIRLILLFNKRAVESGRSLTLIHCEGSIREIFAIGGFDSILTIQ